MSPFLAAEQAQQATIEAIRAVEPQVYLAIINAALEAGGIESLGISSTQRATVINGNSKSAHRRGQGVDISRVNGAAVNNSGYNGRGLPIGTEPQLQNNFTSELFDSSAFNQVFTPYEVRYDIDGAIDTNRVTTGGYNTDIGPDTSRNNYDHRHHIHVGGYRAGSR